MTSTSFTNGQILSAEETERLLKGTTARPSADDSSAAIAAVAPQPEPEPAPEPAPAPKKSKAKIASTSDLKLFKILLTNDQQRLAEGLAKMKNLPIEDLLTELVVDELEQRGHIGKPRIDKPSFAKVSVSAPSFSRSTYKG
jgi:3-oxoacyl-ACP reductase-like protein